MTTFAVKEYDIQYIDRVVELLQDVSVYLPDFEKRDLANQRFISCSSSFGCVAVNGNVVLGFGSIFRYERIRGGASAVIEDLVVSREFRRKGVGTEIVKHLVQWAEDMGCFKVTLQANSDSQHLYKSLGFILGGPNMMKIIAKG